MFDNDGTKNNPAADGLSTFLAWKTLQVKVYDLVPGNGMGELNPSVLFIQTLLDQSFKSFNR